MPAAGIITGAMPAEGMRKQQNSGTTAQATNKPNRIDVLMVLMCMFGKAGRPFSSSCTVMTPPSLPATGSPGCMYEFAPSLGIIIGRTAVPGIEDMPAAASAGALLAGTMDMTRGCPDHMPCTTVKSRGRTSKNISQSRAYSHVMTALTAPRTQDTFRGFPASTESTARKC
jgi:hypothetical protein